MSEPITKYDLSSLAQTSHSSHGKILVICPKCLQEKNLDYKGTKLEIRDDYQVGYCHRCGSSFITSDPLFMSRSLDSPSGWPMDRTTGELRLKKEIYDSFDIIDVNSLSYLYDRNPLLLDVNLMDYGVVAQKDKIIIRFLLNMQEYFYQVRFTDPDNTKGKYYTPPSTKPIYFAGGEYNAYRPIIVTEGVFSALAVKLVLKEVNVIACLGSTMTDTQIHMLEGAGAFDCVFSFLDSTKLSTDLNNKIKNIFPSTQIIPSIEGYDPEELLKYFSFSNYVDYMNNNMGRV